MAKFYQFDRVSFFSIILTLLTSHGYTQVQTQTPRPNVNIDTWCNGYYESLPTDYNTSGKKYPLLIFLEGQGEIGNGGSQLDLMLHNGPCQMLSVGTFPSSFTVNGSTYSFIVISPQLNTWPAPNDEPTAVNDIVTYMIAHYRVDTTRVFLTGLSMGGGITWDYAGYTGAAYTKRLAAILPIAGASSPSTYRAAQMAKYHLPVWATHNSGDPTVPVSYTEGYIADLNAAGANPAPLETIFNANQHDAWTETYTSLVQNNMNVFQWMLQYQRVGDSVIANGTSVVLPVELTDYGLDVTGSTVDIHWSTAQEVNNRYFILQRSADGQTFADLDTVPSAGSGGHIYAYYDEHPLSGNNFYRLEQVDIGGEVTFFGVLRASFGSATGSAFIISPNPARSMINLQLTSKEEGTIHASIVDVQGRVLQTLLFNKQGQQWTQAVNVGMLSPGSYFIRLDIGEYRAVQGFIKE